MATGEDQLESFIAEARLTHRILRCLERRCPRQIEQAGFGGQHPVPTDPINGSIACRRHQPVPGVGGDSVSRPAFRGDREGFLRGFLGEVEIAEEADQGSENAPPLLPEDLLQDPYQPV
jgi:hypothetical protein